MSDDDELCLTLLNEGGDVVDAILEGGKEPWGVSMQVRIHITSTMRPNRRQSKMLKLKLKSGL